MDFRDKVLQLSDRIDKLKDNIPTEEATKNAFIMPFMQLLGYDVFNPLEVLPEMHCDIGIKKGEKIDYAIMKEDCPIILIECKHWKQDLSLHDNQLLRYFHVSKAKFGILTNGIKYRFYTDLEAPNKMDEKPFLEFDFENIKEAQIEDLRKFHKSHFDLENILSSASELKYTRELKGELIKEFANPSPEFVKLIAKKVYEGVITPKVLEQFTLLLKRSIFNHVNDIISERLKTALKNESSTDVGQTEITIETSTKEINTTEHEVEAFFIVKSIIRSVLNSERITYRDAQSYFSVFVDDNNRKPICRLYLNSEHNKQLVFVDNNKKEIRNKINCLDDIYLYSEQLIEIAKKYIE